MAITTRTEFLDYCLRRLGAPVVEVNVDPSQVDDAYDDSLKIFIDYYYDASIKTFYKYQVTATDIANGYMPVPDHVIGISRAIPFSFAYGAQGTLSEAQFQIILSDIYAYTGTDIIGYNMSMSHLSLIDNILNPLPPIQYNQYMKRVSFTDGMHHRVHENDWVIFEVHMRVHPDEFPYIFNNKWFKDYTTALIKRAWGTNLKKFDGMALPGGITIDGRSLYQEALAEIEQLEIDLKTKMQPARFYMG